MNTLATLDLGRADSHDAGHTPILIRVPLVRAVPSATSVEATRRRRLRREIRWSIQLVGAIAIFVTGMAIGRPGRATSELSLLPTPAETAPRRALIAERSVALPIADAGRGHVVLRGILPAEEEDRYDGR